MKQENQNLAYKESWKDEYLKWICGFANANGGKIFIGIKDNKQIIGVADSKRLLEEIPNKTKDILGIIVDVKIIKKEKKEIIEIDIEPHPYPINYKGQYHYRTGSTKQELKGTALDKFLLQKQGKHWDSVPLPKFKLKDISKNAILYFKQKASNTNRLTNNILAENDKLLLQNLQLIEGEYLKSACALLFYDNPQKYVTGAYIKIGFFNTDEELLYQDIVEGNLFEQAENSMNLLLTKYLKATIDYKGIHRSESFPYPVSAIREALINAIAHKDYSTCNPIQISVYANKIIFYNDGQLPENRTVDTLLKKHPSKPSNPTISKIFFHSGLIEAWGRGTLKIINECKKYNLPIPIFTCEFSGFIIIFDTKNDTKINTKGVLNKDFSKMNDTKNDTKLTDLIIGKIILNNLITIEELAIVVQKSRITVTRYINKLKEQKILERVGPANGGYWKINK